MPIHNDPLHTRLTPQQRARLDRVAPAQPRAIKSINCNTCGADVKDMTGQRCQLHPSDGHSVTYADDDPLAKGTP